MNRILAVFALVALAMVPLSCKRIAGIPQNVDQPVEQNAPLCRISGAGFCDDCNSFNSNLWVRDSGGWDQNLGIVRPSNFTWGGGYYQLRMKAYSYDGAQIHSPVSGTKYSYGFLQSRFKCPDLRRTYFALFFYEGITGGNDEITIEVHKGDSTSSVWRVDFTVYKRSSKPSWQDTSYHPSFDPSAGYHTYAIDYGSGGIRFYVDDQCRATCKVASRPTHPMQIRQTIWMPRYWKGPKPTSDQWMKIDWISYSPY
jgi:beta-glucanase (GH16 family)